MRDYHNLSPRVRQILILAKEESHRLGHNFIGSEQLLIGILSADNGATRLLGAASVNLELARVEVEKMIGRGPGHMGIEPPLTPRARHAIEMARAIADEHSSPLVEPEHLLLGIIALGEGVAFQVFETLGVSLPQLREAVMAQLQSLPQLSDLQPIVELETITSSSVSIPVSRDAPKWLTIKTLPQETGRWVAEIIADGRGLDGPNFRSIGYGDDDYQAIASALESLARTYRNYRK